MLQQILVGTLGADAQLQEKDGHKFTTFRVAHNESWTDAANQKHENTIWVDCILNDHPKVAEYLRRGQQVVVMGTTSLRIYSSAKDRCMKAGMTINVQRIELIGGASDPIPTKLYDSNGVQHDVQKWFQVDIRSCSLISSRGQQFTVDEYGWVYPANNSNSQQTNSTQDEEPAF